MSSVKGIGAFPYIPDKLLKSFSLTGHPSKERGENRTGVKKQNATCSSASNFLYISKWSI